MRSGFVAVVGRPNVGKSTLVNAICGGKVAIVSDKPQTTRRRVLGVANGTLDDEQFQLVLVDLPGFQRPRDAMTERMQRAVEQSLEDVDVVLFALAADERIGPGDRFIAQRVLTGERPVVMGLNKVDRLKPAEIARQIEEAAKLAGAGVGRSEAPGVGPPDVSNFHSLHPVSALTGDGVSALARDLVRLLPEGPPYFPEGEVTDLSVAERVAELVREKALALTREEVPHAISVEVDEIADGVVRALLYVETESQKAILVGKGGSMIKAIGSRARPEIELLLGRKAFLDLQVKVRRKWRRDEKLLERLGIGG